MDFLNEINNEKKERKKEQASKKTKQIKEETNKEMWREKNKNNGKLSVKGTCCFNIVSTRMLTMLAEVTFAWEKKRERCEGQKKGN